MRTLLAALLLLAAPLAFAGSRHHTHVVNSDGEYEINLVRGDDGDDWGSFTRGGVSYMTRDAGVIDAIWKAMEPQRKISEAQVELGRRHAELGSEHAQLGREHAELGREHARAARDGDGERVQRELEAAQEKLEAKQRKLEARQRDLEDQQRALEAKQRDTENAVNRAIERIFEKAVREGKARRQ